MFLQSTIKKPVTVKGVGLHSGLPVSLTLRPAKPGHGIVFVRTDLEKTPQIHVNHLNVLDTQLATTLGAPKNSISTVEHVLAALMGLGVDNCLCEVSGPEVPILDGSAGPFCEAVVEAGLLPQFATKPVLHIEKKVEVQLDGKWAKIEPLNGFEIHASIEWDHPVIGYQEFKYLEGTTKFSEIARARTFCMLSDVEKMKAMGLARGGSLDNAIVLNDTDVLNPGGLRYSDEFVRHKVLDALGDFKLAGAQIEGSVRLHKAGHDLHYKLLSAVFSDKRNYRLVQKPVEFPSRIPELVPAVAY